MGGRHGGVRVSLGVQSFSPELRAVLGRTAQADPAAAFRRLRAAGVANAGLDLIHGIPGQTPELLGADIAAALELRPDHVSWYELDVVEGTALAARLASAPGPRSAAGTAAAAPGPGRHARRPDGRRARGGLPAHRPGALARRLRLVRGQQLRPAGAAGAPQRGVLARPALPRPRTGRREHRRRPALDRRRRPGAWAAALAAGEPPPRALETLDADTRARERFLLAARCGERVPLAEVAAVIDPAVAAASRRLDWFPCTVVQSA